MRDRFGSPAHSSFLQTASAQGNAGAFISVPDVEAFPRIRTFLEVQDAQGNFIRDLTAAQVSVLEDGAARPVSALRLQQPGVQMAVAINPGPSFAIRNAKAISRYDLIRDALRAWALSRMGSTIDDLSLVITDGPAASHTSDPAQWLSALMGHQADPRAAAPTLDTLFKAVNLAADPLPRPGMSRAVLFITPPPEGQLDQASLENVAAQAREQHIAIYVWLVSSSGAFGTQTAQQLTQLSQATGGRSFNFTGEEILPSLEEYLAPLRYIYALEYESGVSSAQSHEISVQVEMGEASIVTPALTFEVDIRPPQPAIVDPPIQIERKLEPPTAASMQADAPQAAGGNDAKQIAVVFDFPDGRMRPLVYSALLVDGVVASENTQPPFDRFTWKLDGITTSGVHRLQVQARDTFGLTGTSLEIPVQVSVQRSAASAMSGVQRNLPIIAALTALLAGAVLALVLVVGGKLRPRPLRAARQRRKIDPVTQPVHISVEAPAVRRSNWANRLQWPGRGPAPAADAYLNPLPDSPDEDTLPPIPIHADELILGSLPDQAAVVIDDPSVEAVHARLTRHADGSYRLADEGSLAGTWINYTPVSKEGARLENGDLIHIGRIGFRFTLRKPAAGRKPIIITDGASAAGSANGAANGQPPAAEAAGDPAEDAAGEPSPAEAAELRQPPPSEEDSQP